MGLPLMWRMTAGALLIGGFGLSAAWCYRQGHAAGVAEATLTYRNEQAQIDNATRAQAESAQRTITKTVTKFVQQAAQDRVLYRDIIKEVPIYVPSDLPVLSGSFRVLHDAAASGRALPDAGDSSRTDAATVTAQELAVTLVDNYAACREDQERLRALQEVVREMVNKN
jgi:hypothetical protein